MENLFILAILGTTRSGRQSEKAAKKVVEIGNTIEGIEVELVDPKDFPPFGNSKSDQNYEDLVKKADGFFIITPEYNHSFPGDLKIILDKQLKNYIHKPVALAGVSSGFLGGARVIEHLTPVVRELGMAVTFTDIHFPYIKDAFDENGNLTDEKQSERIKKAYDELIWMAKSLKWGRENL